MHAADVPQVSVEEDMAETLECRRRRFDHVRYFGPQNHGTGREHPANSTFETRERRLCLSFGPARWRRHRRPMPRPSSRTSRATERQRLQREIIDKFPNVQIFDVADIVATVQKLVNNFVLAISFVGSFVILSGILILIGSVALTKSQRIYENAILKTLGAHAGRHLRRYLLAEYGLLGLLSGLIGAGFAVLLSFAVSRYILDIKWEFAPFLMVAGVVVTTLLVMVVGAAASFDVLFRKPLATLRSQ